MIQILYHLVIVKSIFPKLNPEGKKQKQIEFTKVIKREVVTPVINCPFLDTTI